MKNCSRPISILLFLCVTLLGGRRSRRPEPPICIAPPIKLRRAPTMRTRWPRYARSARLLARLTSYRCARAGLPTWLATTRPPRRATARPLRPDQKLSSPDRAHPSALRCEEVARTTGCGKQVLSQDGKNPTVRARLAAAQYNLGDLTNAAQDIANSSTSTGRAGLPNRTWLGPASHGKGPDARQSPSRASGLA